MKRTLLPALRMLTPSAAAEDKMYAGFIKYADHSVQPLSLIPGSGTWSGTNNQIRREESDAWAAAAADAPLADALVTFEFKLDAEWFPLNVFLRGRETSEWGSGGGIVYLSGAEGVTVGSDHDSRNCWGSLPGKLKPGQWYRLKLRLRGKELALKLWQSGNPEPAEYSWKGEIPDLPERGLFGLGSRTAFTVRALAITEDLAETEPGVMKLPAEPGEAVRTVVVPGGPERNGENTLRVEWRLGSQPPPDGSLRLRLYGRKNNVENLPVNRENWEWLFFSLNQQQWVVSPSRLELPENSGQENPAAPAWTEITVPFGSGILREGVNTLEIWNCNSEENGRRFTLELACDASGRPLAQLLITGGASGGEPLTAGETFAATVLDPMTKVRGGASVQRTGEDLELLAAANEFESVQIALLGGKSALEPVFVPSDLKTADGELLSGRNWRIGLEKYVPQSDGTFWPDPILPGAVETLQPGALQVYFATLFVPPGTRPGVYTGEIRICEPDAARPGQSAVIPVKLTVAGFSLPEIKPLQMMVEGYSNRIPNSYGMYPFNCAEGAPAPRYILTREGEIRLDFTEFDRDAAYLLEKRGARAFSLGMAVVGANLLEPSYMERTFYNEATGKKERLSLNPLKGPAERARFESVLRRFEAHLKGKGWLDRAYLYLSDEAFAPEFVRMVEEIGKIARETAPGIRHAIVGGKLTEAMAPNIHVTMVNHFRPGLPEELAERGIEYWWYTCGNLANPSWTIPQEGIAARIFPWLNWKFRIPASLHWAAIIADYDALEERIKVNGREWDATGDGVLFYQDETGRLLPSLRSELWRDGLEDHAAFALLAELCDRLQEKGEKAHTAELDEARKLLDIPDSLIKSNFEYAMTPAQLQEYRRRIYRQIEVLQKLDQNDSNP